MKRLNTLSKPGAEELHRFVAQTFGQFNQTCFVEYTNVCQEVRSVYNNVGNPPARRAQALATLLAASSKYPALLTLKDEKAQQLSERNFGFKEFSEAFAHLPHEEVAGILRKVGLVRDVPNALQHTNSSIFLGI